MSKAPFKLLLIDTINKDVKCIFQGFFSYNDYPNFNTVFAKANEMYITIPNILNTLDNNKYEEGIYSYDIKTNKYTLIFKTDIFKMKDLIYID